jgi:23S rRNA pseudouridine1911/1915/1917 synthase
VNALAYHFEKNGEKSDLDRVGLVHRIDKDTSGLLVIAKNEYALSFLAKQFFDRTQRLYWAFVWGNVQDDEGTIRGHIGDTLKTECRCIPMKTEARENML